MSIIAQTAIFLAAAVIAVPLFKRAGLGAVLGYLSAGVVIGPAAIGLIDDVEDVLHFAEFGVVLLLFVIGLELQPARLWAMRRLVFGLGSLQFAVTGSLLAGIGYALGLDVIAAALCGMALALSSTAFALQTLAEKGQLGSRHGRAAFGVLLFQDLAVIPLLALIPIVAGPGLDSAGNETWLAIAKAAGALVGMVVGGHYVLRYALRVIALSRVPEAFTAVALLTVIGAALLMEHVGLSMGLGAFLAGVLLAESEHRHALEADIEPFKGLLLGLFFMAVGMSVDLGLVAERPLDVLALVAGLLGLKFLVLYGLGRTGGLGHGNALNLAGAISQGGEFAFVLLSAGLANGLIADETSALLVLVVTASMVASPLISALAARPAARAIPAREGVEREPPPGDENQVIIAGFGRFGQVVGRVLRARHIGFTALDKSQEQIDFVARFGNKVYYGDAADIDLLRAARADRAAIFVLAIDDVEASVRAARVVAEHFPNLMVCARARNRRHAYRLMDLGVKIVRRETFLSSLDLTREVLLGLGFSEFDAEKSVQTFRRHDERRLIEHHAMHTDEERMIYLAKQAMDELKDLFEEDARSEAADRG